jgi:hypothetical protein
MGIPSILQTSYWTDFLNAKKIIIEIILLDMFVFFSAMQKYNACAQENIPNFLPCLCMVYASLTCGFCMVNCKNQTWNKNVFFHTWLYNNLNVGLSDFLVWKIADRAQVS